MLVSHAWSSVREASLPWPLSNRLSSKLTTRWLSQTSTWSKLSVVAPADACWLRTGAQLSSHQDKTWKLPSFQNLLKATKVQSSPLLAMTPPSPTFLRQTTSSKLERWARKMISSKARVILLTHPYKISMESSVNTGTNTSSILIFKRYYQRDQSSR